MNEDRQNIILDDYDAAVLMAIATSVNAPIEWREIILNFLFYKKTVIWYQYLNESLRRLVAASFLTLEKGVVQINEEMMSQFKAILRGTHADYTSTEQLLKQNPINKDLLANTPEKIISVQEFEDGMNRFYEFLKAYMPKKLAPRMISDDMLLIESISTDPTYGLNPENPIYVCSFGMGGTTYIQLYFNSLLGHNGKPIRYRRVGPCISVDTPVGKCEHGITDLYAVFIEGIEKPINVFINTYDCELPLKAPIGFKIKKETK